MNPEEQFALCRELAGEGSYDEARDIARAILKENPAYFDVSIYLARIYGWESGFDSAYHLLEGVLEKEPGLMEAHEAIVDVAFWENNWEKLIEVAEPALLIEPAHQEINRKVELARRLLFEERDVPELMLQYYYDHFSEPYARNWHMLSLGAVLQAGPVSLNPYISTGYSAGASKPATDIQFNLDAYTRLGKLNTLLTGYGFSPNGSINYMPTHRAALELWQVLPAGFGISAGLRYFYWTDHFTFLTFSGEKYLGNYYFSLRNYLFFKDAGPSASWYLGARRYFESKDHYLGLTLGYGTAPDEPVFVESDLDRLNALSVKAAYARRLRHNLRMSLVAGYANEEYKSGQYRHRIDLSATLYVAITKWKL